MRSKTDHAIEEILRLVEVGEWSPGHRLPRLGDLAQRLDVSVGTTRSALERLVGSGQLYKKGHGWHVDRRTRGQPRSPG